MTRAISCTAVGLLLCLLASGDADGRGFGGFRGGFSYGGGLGGYRAGGYGGYRGFSSFDRSYGGFDRSFGYSGARSFDTYSGWRGAGAASSYDRSFAGARGGSISTEGSRALVAGPLGGVAAGGRREVTATGPEGRTVSGE